MELHYSSSREDIEKQLVEYIINIIQSREVILKPVIIALSGGSTPINLYKRLAEAFQSLERDYSIHVIQVDERFVSKDSERSNQKMIADIFPFDNKKLVFHPIPMIEQFETAKDSAEIYSMILETLFEKSGTNQIDISILGIGDDMHTASLFPNNEGYLTSLEKNEHYAIDIDEKTVPEPRVSLTPSIINQSIVKILHFYGISKARNFQSAIEAGDPVHFPIVSMLSNLVIFTDQKLKIAHDD